jgi:4-amino-4-deoxy-L-arabinose transferase-like glycosyltransferase
VIEREWREATDLKPSTLWLAVTLAVAALLRLWAPGYGIPWAVGAEEAENLGRVLAIMRSGDYNPHAFDQPGLIFWLHLPVACARFLLGAMRGHWTSLAEVPLEALVPWARVFTALVGVGTVAIVHQVGMRWGARHALIAAGLLAVMPLHVVASRHATSDVPLTLFTTLCLLLSLVAHERATPRAFASAGVAAGLAFATSYGGLLALTLPLLAAWMTYPGRPSRLSYVLTTVGAALVTYLVVAPFTLFDLPGFLNGFAAFSTAFRARTTGLAPQAWLVYLVELRRALGWPALLLLVAGFTMGVVRAIRGPGRVRWALVVAFPVLLYVALSRRGAPDTTALLPAIPVACVLAGNAVISGVSLLRRFSIPRAPRTALIAALTIAALLPPSLGSIAFTRGVRAATTSEAAWRWIDAHAVPGQRLVIERDVLHVPSPRFDAVRVEDVAERRWSAGGVGVPLLIVGPADHLGKDARARRDVLLQAAREVARFEPEAKRRGPVITIYEPR